jgi:hypothetical protein
MRPESVRCPTRRGPHRAAASASTLDDLLDVLFDPWDVFDR